MLPVLFILVVAAYAVAVVVLLLKGNSKQVTNGILVAPIWIVSAFRVAEPDSWWAKTFYDDLQMEKARVRSEFRRKDEDPETEPGGRIYGVAPDEGGVAPTTGVECRLCRRVCPGWEEAVAHADQIHTEVTFEDAKTALVELKGQPEAGSTSPGASAAT